MARNWALVNEIPDRTCGGGVYALYLRGELVYVGHTRCFYSRLMKHRRRFLFDGIKVAQIEDRSIRLNLERRLLFRLRPRVNQILPRVYRPKGFTVSLVCESR